MVSLLAIKCQNWEVLFDDESDEEINDNDLISMLLCGITGTPCILSIRLYFITQNYHTTNILVRLYLEYEIYTITINLLFLALIFDKTHRRTGSRSENCSRLDSLQCMV